MANNAGATKSVETDSTLATMHVMTATTRTVMAATATVRLSQDGFALAALLLDLILALTSAVMGR